MESKLLSVCSKLANGMYPRDDTLLEKLLSTLDSEFMDFERLYHCGEFLAFVQRLQSLEKNEKHQAVSAVIRILGVLWNHQPLEVFKKEVSAVLNCWLSKDTKTLPKSVLHACVCCLTYIFNDGYGDQRSLVKESIPFVRNCLAEDSLFVRNAAKHLLTELMLHALSQKKQNSSCDTEIQDGRMPCNETSKTDCHVAAETNVKSLVGKAGTTCEVEEQVITCFEVYVIDRRAEYHSSPGVGLGLILELCQYLDHSMVYEYLVNGLQAPQMIVQQFPRFVYTDMVTSLEILSALYKYRQQVLTSDLVQTMCSMCQDLLQEEKSLEASLLASWILQCNPSQSKEACSLLYTTMQSCVRQDTRKTYVHKSIKTLTRCLASVHYMHCQRQEVLQFLCGLLNPDLGAITVTSVTETLKVQAAAIDALSLRINDADISEIKAIIQTCVYILRTSDLTFQKISKALNCILKALGELGRINQTHSGNGGTLSDVELNDLVFSLLTNTTFTSRPDHKSRDGLNINHSQTVVENEPSNTVACEVKKPGCQDISHADTGNVIEMCLLSVKWEVRDSALEFVGSLATLTKEFPGIFLWLEKCDFVSLVWYGVEDKESYVRASALKALEQWLEEEVTRTLVLADLSQETIVTKAMEIAEIDCEAFPRRAAVNFLTKVYQLNFWPSAYKPVLELMHKLINDSDWDVKMRVLMFWEVFIDVQTLELEGSTTVIPAYAKDIMSNDDVLHVQEKSELMEEFLCKLCESHLPSVLFMAVHDCDPAVQEKALLLVKKLKSTCSEDGFCKMEESQTRDVNTQCKDEPLNGNITERSLDTVQSFVCWLQSKDVETLTRRANQGTDDTHEQLDALLDDILVALGDTTGNKVTEEEDNNAAAIDCY